MTPKLFLVFSVSLMLLSSQAKAQQVPAKQVSTAKAKTASATKASAKTAKAAAKTPKSKTPKSKTPYMLQSANHVPLHLDYSQYPIDPRKPCSQCVRPCDSKTLSCYDLPGIKGRPNVDKPLGGIQCNDCNCRKNKCPLTNVYWPVPLAARREYHHPGFSGWLDDPCRKRLVDVFDKLGDVRISGYRRTDSGYYGKGRDPYGCLGESKQLQSGVSGLQFRQPGEPVFGSPVYTGNLPGQTTKDFGFGFPSDGNHFIR